MRFAASRGPIRIPYAEFLPRILDFLGTPEGCAVGAINRPAGLVIRER
jgi:hypothetical protein